MSNKHTPAPWKIERHGKLGYSRRVVTDVPKDADGLINGKYYDDVIDDGAYGDPPILPEDSDLDHIVYCVNIHDELVEALTHAVEIAEGECGGTWDDLLKYRKLINKSKGK